MVKPSEFIELLTFFHALLFFLLLFLFKQLCGSCCDEEWVAVMWTGEDVVKAIMDSTLVSQFKNITSSVYPDKRILLLIFAMDLYHRYAYRYNYTFIIKLELNIWGG